MAETAVVKARGLTRRVRTGSGDELTILSSIDLDLWAGRITAVVGPNAVGKTTLARVIAGIDPVSGGTLKHEEPIDGRPLCGMVFQEIDETLLPWRSNLRNASFGLEAQGIDSARAAEQVGMFLDEHGLSLPCNKFPLQSSGGERQMVTVVRAAVTKPMLLVLDEPFSRIDPSLITRWRQFIRSYAQDTRAAVLFVTHNIGDVLEVADEVAVVSRSVAGGASFGLKLEIQVPVPRGEGRKESSRYIEYFTRILQAIDEAHTR